MLTSEYEWLKDHPEERLKYRGEYIAVWKQAIVCHHSNLKDLMKEIEIYAGSSADKVLVSKVPG